MGRPSREASRSRKRRAAETEVQSVDRRTKTSAHNKRTRSEESEYERNERLCNLKKYQDHKREFETTDQKAYRLRQDRERHRNIIRNESDFERIQRLDQARERDRKVKENENELERATRLEQARERDRKVKENESELERAQRLELARERDRMMKENESELERATRLEQARERDRKVKENESELERAQRLEQARERDRIVKENENELDRATRLEQARERDRKVKENESELERAQRLELARERDRMMKENESELERATRLEQARERYRMMKENESELERAQRLELARERDRMMKENESELERAQRLELARERDRMMKENESELERAQRLELARERDRMMKENESELERTQRLEQARERERQVIEDESDSNRANRLEKMRSTARNRRKISNMCDFQRDINIFADASCAICRKCLYPIQRVKLRTTNFDLILPRELMDITEIMTCSRCATHIKKRKVPSQAYWNKMSVSPIPDEISNLSDIESKFLCRIVPFLRIIKVNNKFSQDWCKGQVVLFARDVVELAEQLPLEPNQTGLIIVAESLENVDASKEFQINTTNLQAALRWLMKNNALYHDVRPHFTEIIDLTPIIQIEPSNKNQETSNADDNNTTVSNSYVQISGNVSILRGTFHQGSEQFNNESRGRQCTAIATTACVISSVFNPIAWSCSDVDHILIMGDKYYRDCIRARAIPDAREANTEYLAATELLSELNYNGRNIHVHVDHDIAYNGNVDIDDSQNGFPNLKNALLDFCSRLKCGILTVNEKTVAIICEKTNSGSYIYWYFDSHPRGPKGCAARSKGTACCMRFTTIDKMYDILRRNLFIKVSSNSTNPTLNVYSLTPIHAQPDESSSMSSSENTVELDSHLSRNVVNYSSPPNTEKADTSVNVSNRFMWTTSMLRSVDEAIPNLDTVISVDNTSSFPDMESNPRLANINRKTAPPLNIEREKRMEELAWFFLFPDGKNGFGEEREIQITPLDYFQSRVMGTDRRFQRNDYLFFGLSIVEYFRAKSSVSVSCRMRQDDQIPEDLVENMHLTMRNIRGSSAYWHKCCSELVAMVRCLGPPTWFMTLSCNDLNWPDMTKALLLADGRDIADAVTLTFPEKMDLVNRHPMVIARQFTVRVNALMRYLKHNDNVLGGPIIDFWYRIEFQNRGSPHLHMLVWCQNIAEFSTEEGLRIINQVVSCNINPDDPCLTELVRTVQIHKHTSTCYKDRNNSQCRFGFPRLPSGTTTTLDPDEAIKNNGRVCVLRRNENEAMVNNYNPDILKLWEGNMDIQPCGNVSAVAYYVAKYASKCEPNDSGDVVKEAIAKAKKTGGALWQQLFSVSMAILSQRLVSAVECAYRLSHLPLKMSSRKAVFVNSCFPEQRYRLLRFDTEETSTYQNIFDRYEQRPDNLEEISLAEFAVRYETISNANAVQNEEDGDIELREPEPESPRFIRLRDNSRMRVRTREAVLRTRFFTMTSDKEAYFYNLIVCHIPFRKESELLLENETAEACFLRRQTELRPLSSDMTSEQFAHAEQTIQNALAQAVAFNTVHETETATDVVNDGTATIDQAGISRQHIEDYCDDISNEPVMTEDVYKCQVRGLNSEQKSLFRKVSTAVENNINGGDSQLLLFTTGGAGSGKSFLLKLIVEHIKRCYAPTVDAMQKVSFVEVGSLTGVAARQVLGKTIHSLFTLPIQKGNTLPYQQLTGQRLETERRRWRHCNWLIIDEVSMVSYENLRMIHLRLQEFKNNQLLFGGINVLLFGDIMQLPPVKGHWCYMQPPWCAAEINLWQQFQFCELTINMRQRSDTEFIDLLNKLRFGELTVSQLELLCERRRAPSNEFEDGVVVRIFPTVKQVDEYNVKMSKLNQNHSYEIWAEDESREVSTYGMKPPITCIPSDVNNCGGLLTKITLAVESRVMLRRNLSVGEGLVNGTMGVIKHITWPAFRRDQLEVGELPESIHIKFDDPTVGRRQKDQDGNVAIAPVCVTYQGTRGYGDIERRMLPVILSWAVTVHKLQGTTLDKAVIDLGKRNFAKGQVYVALSRVKTLNGIALSDLDPKKVLNKPHDERSMDEMKRLRSLNSNNS